MTLDRAPSDEERCTLKSHRHDRPEWEWRVVGHCNVPHHMVNVDECRICGEEYDAYIQSGADE